MMCTGGNREAGMQNCSCSDGSAGVRRAFSLRSGIQADRPEQPAYLCLLAGLLHDAIGRIVELPGHNAEEFCLVFVSVVIGRSNADQLRDRRQTRELSVSLDFFFILRVAV